MGQSTDAIMAYGYVWDDETELWDDDRYDEWPEFVAEQRGHTSPWDFYRESGAEAEHSNLPYQSQRLAFEAWEEEVGFKAMLREWKSALETIKAEHPEISVKSHCSCDYPMPYICVTDTEQRASRGYPVAFDPEKMAQNEEIHNWQGYLAMFVEALDIDISGAQGPGWFLVSNWC